ncbi:DUF4158 domain-containing protein, partial [Pseudovibrio sp. POLY-S9]|uniref:DUF4158 domain-containing protein n=1 Tax=Pseudovibrio sp. POLY-S9 TaxID=1576596 RepID=UPI00070AFC77
MARMQILSASEQSAFDTPPLFDFRERQKFFDLSKALLETAGTLQNPAYQVFFLVSCGYFRATKRFFSPDTFHQRDVAYVASKLNVNDVSAINYSSRARQRHQKVILAHYGVNQFDKNSRKMLALEIAAMSEAHLKPRLI